MLSAESNVFENIGRVLNQPQDSKKARVEVGIIEVFKDQPNEQQLQEPHQVFVDAVHPNIESNEFDFSCVIRERMKDRIKNWKEYSLKMRGMLNEAKSFSRLRRSLRKEIREKNRLNQDV